MALVWLDVLRKNKIKMSKIDAVQRDLFKNDVFCPLLVFFFVIFGRKKVQEKCKKMQKKMQKKKKE